MDLLDHANGQGGQLCVNVNGERSPYFKTFRGLRHGDPLSPLLFDLVVDTVGLLIRKQFQRVTLKGFWMV